MKLKIIAQMEDTLMPSGKVLEASILIEWSDQVDTKRSVVLWPSNLVAMG